MVNVGKSFKDIKMNEFEDAFNEAVHEVALCLSEELKDMLNKKKLWVKEWVGRRDTIGASTTLFRELASEDPLEYKRHLRLSVNQFNELLSFIEHSVSKTDTVMRAAIPARLKLEVTLRYLASGDNFQSLSLLFRTPATTISRFLPEVLRAIIMALQQYIQVPQSAEEWEDIAKSFGIKWNFPSCYGAIDGKHIAIKRPPGSCAEFYNYKGHYSIILLALVDADCRFIYVDIGTNGRANDGSVYRLSQLKKALDQNELHLPNDYIIVGDDAFPLGPNLMKPYSKRHLTLVERIYNYRLSRARRVVENAFGILAARFRVFGKEIEVELSTVDLIVQSACAIHNWLRTTSPRTYFEREWVDYEDTETGVLHPGQWRAIGTYLPSIGLSRSTNPSSKRASDKRKQLALYFNGEGSVPWQMKAIGLE